MTYQQTLDYMYEKLPMFQRIGAAAYKADLSNTIIICKTIGNPEKNLKCIHIAGTNGKGSTSHMIASILQSAGYKTGLYTSPHLKDFRERIKINGKKIEKNFVTRFIDEFKNEFEKINPSFFELTFGMAMNYFYDKKVDYAVIETGMGGRLDSTNVIQPIVSIITNIGKDHTQFLGNTLQKIASEKAGIIKQKIPVIISETQKETKQVFIKKAIQNNTTCLFADNTWKNSKPELEYKRRIPFLKTKFTNTKNKEAILIKSPLSGLYQIKNIKGVLTAVSVLNSLQVKISNKNIVEGIANVVVNTQLLGRWQKINQTPPAYADTGHNTEGIKEVLKQIKLTPHNKLHFVFGTVNDKNILPVIKLLPQKASYYFCKADLPRAMNEVELTRIAIRSGLKGKTFRSVREAYKNALKSASNKDLIVVGGSTFVVAEVL